MKNKTVFALIIFTLLINAQTFSQPIRFLSAIPQKILLTETVNFSFSVNLNEVTKYRFKLNPPGSIWGGISFNLYNWSDWYQNEGTNILFSDFVKEGQYEFLIEYINHKSQKNVTIKKSFYVYWENPMIRTESFNINYNYINSATNEKEKYRRAAEEWLSASNMWMNKYEYEYRLLNIQKQNPPREIIKILSDHLIATASAKILASVGGLPSLTEIIAGLSLAALIRQGVITLAILYRNVQVNLATTMAAISDAFYRTYQNRYKSL